MDVYSSNQSLPIKVDDFVAVDPRNYNAVGLGYTAQTDVARPANTTAYTAGDVVGSALAAITLADVGPANGHIVITSADLRVDVAAVPAGMSAFRLHLYNASPVSALADNAVWDLPAGDRAAYLGYIDFDTPIDAGSTLYSQMNFVNKKLKMGTTTSLFGYLVTTAGYTPTSASVMSVRLNALGA